MWKKTLATLSILAGILILILDFAVLKLSHAAGFWLAAGGIVLFLQGLIVLCIVNRNKYAVAETVDFGLSFLETLLDIFFDL